MRRLSGALVTALSLVVLMTSGVLGAAGDRTLVNARRIEQRPFNGVVLVSVGRGTVCTGFVVARRKVVTAAHCLARDASAGDYRFKAGLPGIIRLYRGFSAAVGGSAFPACGVARAWAHSRFIRRRRADRAFGSAAHDYAVLTAAPGCVYPANSIMRMWPTTLSGGELASGTVSKLAGYPADHRFERMNGLNMWRMRGRIQPSADPRVLRTTGFVARGMSGGPIWRSFNRSSPCGRSECIVGIITECAVNATGLCKLGDSVRRAVRITPAVRRIIRSH